MSQKKIPWREVREWGGWGAAVAIAVIAGVSLYLQLGPGPRLRVDASHGPFSVPEGYKVSWEAGADAEAKKPRIRMDSWGHEKWLGDEPPSPIEYASGYAEISIKNLGDRAAKELALASSDCRGMFRIRREGGEVEVDGFRNRVELGDLAQEEVVEISLWTADELTADSKFTLTYFGGKHSFSLGASQGESGGGLLPRILAALAGLVIGYSSRVIIGRLQKKNEADEVVEEIARLIPTPRDTD